MTSIIKLNVLSGAMDESPPCYMLQIDDARILLDCGWNEHFDQNFLNEISKHVKHIDAVLLSHPDPAHLGALPYLVGKCGLSCPVYATVPVYKMGQMFMYDLYQSRYNNEDFTIFNLDDVDAAFDKIVQLKYNQTARLKGRCHGLNIVPIAAGHMIGGTIWRIKKIGEEDIVYAVDFNHKKERHLNGCSFARLQRPSILITNSFNSTFQQERRKVRDEKLFTNILQTLSNNGSVLIAVDTAGRVLELALMLEQLWSNENSGLQNHFLCFLNNVSYNVIEFAKSQIEWMSDELMKSFESARFNPFQVKYIKTCHSLIDIHKISVSKVVLASMPDLECGFARDLCLEWLSDPANTIIFTSRTSRGTLARKLIDLTPSQKTIHVTVKKRERLTGEELANYRKEQDSSEFDSSDSEDLQIIGNITKSHDFVVKQEQTKKKKRKYSISRSYPIYPAEDIKKKNDEYGEIIAVADYMKEIKDHKINKEKLDDDIKDIVEYPTKCVTHEKEIEIKASIQLIEFEGKSDGESLQKIITRVHPRMVILVRSPLHETGILANYLRQWAETNVFTPSKGDIVDATTEAHIYQIRLTDALASSLNMQQGGDNNSDLELAWVDAITAQSSRSCKPQLKNKNQETEQNGDIIAVQDKTFKAAVQNDDLLMLEPVVEKSEIIPHSTIFVNELKLSDLKQVIVRNGIDCEFSGGVLFCANRSIAIRRDHKRKISIEGCLSEDYYKVRTLLYGQYAIL
ncbi:probable cleavage and polyadenylation specificity factor subunit 2 [Rhodnius prolixus]|uniref:probable cleavage and polyadenylation specificity factor subunit 2 n=1 Tax=Rhodnius prolixus TaxID=13249 RepID=UPI003D1897F4